MLLVHNRLDNTSRYSHYLRELLAIEGFTGVGEVDATDLGDRLGTQPQPSLIILPRTHLPEATNTALLAYVREGGRLLVLHPEPALARMLGLRPTFSTVQDGILTCADREPLAGLPLDPVQVIVPAVTLANDGTGGPIAMVTQAHDPLVTSGGIWHLTIGLGRAVIVAFDLAAAVARLRHGNPALADIPNHRWDHIQRPSDLFPGQLDTRQAAVPQADVLTAILGRLVETLAPHPRLWYYPDANQRGALVMTSDDDWSTRDQFAVMTDVMRQYDATCTFYVVHSSVLDADLIARYEQDGHIFSVHPSMPGDTRSANPVNEAQMWWVPDMVRTEVARHKREHQRPVNTIRNHAIRWVGYMDLAYIHAELGIRAEANSVSVGIINAGFMIGSGRVAPFVDVDGTVIDHLQVPTHWTEEALVSGGHSSSERWQYCRAQEQTNGIITRGINRYHTPVALNSHPVSFATYSQPLIESNWQTARENGAPIVSADAWVAWTDARRGVSVTSTTAGFSVRSERAVPRVTILFPSDSVVSVPEGTVSSQTIWGQRHDAVELNDVRAGETREITANVARLAAVR